MMSSKDIDSKAQTEWTIHYILNQYMRVFAFHSWRNLFWHHDLQSMLFSFIHSLSSCHQFIQFITSFLKQFILHKCNVSCEIDIIIMHWNCALIMNKLPLALLEAFRNSRNSFNVESKSILLFISVSFLLTSNMVPPAEHSTDFSYIKNENNNIIVFDVLLVLFQITRVWSFHIKTNATSETKY